MTLDDLTARLREIEGRPEAAGLEAFISQARKLPPGVTIMGKIQRSFVDLSARGAIEQATTFDGIKAAIGDQYRVTLESVE